MSWLKPKPPRPDPGLDHFRNAVGQLRQDGSIVGHIVVTVEQFWGCANPIRAQERMWVYPFLTDVPLPDGMAPLEYRGIAATR